MIVINSDRLYLDRAFLSSHYCSSLLCCGRGIVHVIAGSVTIAMRSQQHYIYSSILKIWAGYWSSFSFWVILATRSFKVRSPRTQHRATSSVGHSRSRLFLAPLKTTVKHCFSGTDPDIRLSASDWQPSRTHSTSVTATGWGEDKTRKEMKWKESCNYGLRSK